MSDERGPWLKWAWQNYVLDVDDFDTLDEAIAAASYASNMGEESLECIEGPDGVVDPERAEALIAAHDERARQARPDEPPRPFAIKVRGPVARDHAWWDTYATEAERDAAAEALRARFGDRVAVGTNPWKGPR